LRALTIIFCAAFAVTLSSCGPSDGPHQDHYGNGKVKEEGAYKNGEKSGKWTYYWQNGKKKTVGYYSKGKPTGEWVYFSKEGSTLGKGSYKNGKMWNGTFVRFVMGIPKMMTIEEGKEKGK
jgi:antitoxin component YwqK of YwqJK toxin-antitoxin module